MNESLEDLDRDRDGWSVRLAQGFQRRTATLAAAARRVRDGTDPDAIHDLRVATRRLGAALRVWSNLLEPRAARVARRRLRDLRRRLGEAREVEVNVALLEVRLSGSGPVARTALAPLLERMRRRLARRRRRARARVRPRLVRRLVRRIEDATRDLGATLRREPSALASALAIERKAEARSRSALWDALELADDLSLHEARIAVKNWRYKIESLGDALPSERAGGIAGLREVQDVLGEIHDRALLRDLLARAARVADPAHTGGLERLIDELDAERREGIEEFRRIGAGLAAIPHDEPQAEPGRAAGIRTVEPGDTGRDTRWEQMARWLSTTKRRA